MSHLSSDTDWLLLTRAAEGTLTPFEQQTLDAWIDIDPVAHRALLDSVTDLRTRSALSDVSVDSRASLASARRRLGLDQSADSFPRHVPASGVRWWVASGLLAAGILVGAVVLSSRSERSSDRTYAAQAGSQLRITLSDGTQVVLAPSSRLQVARDYGAKGRGVTLDGEAYFAVVHDTRHPFVVHAGQFVARDVGTEFTIRAYAGEQATVAVTQGAVALTGMGEARVLHSGDIATADTATVNVVHLADLSPFVGWMQNQLVFTKMPLADVVRDLSRTFNLSITVSDTALAKQRITATFDHETVSQVLEDLVDIVGGSYQRNGRDVVIRRGSVKVQNRNERTAAPLMTAQTQEPHE